MRPWRPWGFPFPLHHSGRFCRLLEVPQRVLPHLTERRAIMIGLIGVVGLLLAALHGVEAALWAAAYWWLGALNSPKDAILYSVDSMSTLGGSGLTLERHWQLMGALEAMDGMLLFGISTAYMFAMMQAYWPLMTRGRPH